MTKSCLNCTWGDFRQEADHHLYFYTGECGHPEKSIRDQVLNAIEINSEDLEEIQQPFCKVADQCPAWANEFASIAHEWLKGLSGQRFDDGRWCHSVAIQGTEIRETEEFSQTFWIDADFFYNIEDTVKEELIYEFDVSFDPDINEYKIESWDVIGSDAWETEEDE
ncbi:hypothetical protein I8748_31870 [Nostoc sp. CENA67]|uniref:Uncharacterized protein n=1 Tax=Amazonocrinis nigriterrae CENA67 TaxID=2794033 RepID=A0A8J7HVM2_9NOST|nr:hypothetical protein [Amazonocrinis nigriterrae]MBH8566697.1 hypothetical protein [Amazonocrinis nigriterrae CENA67]